MEPTSTDRLALPHVLRFSVASPDGRRSMAWRVWTGDRRPTGEVYIAPRHMAGDLKFSAHSSGHTQFGPTKRLRDRSSPDDREALSKTELATEGSRVLLRLLFHRSELRTRTADRAEATVEMADDEEALLILLAVGRLPADMAPGCRLAGAVARDPGDPVLVIAAPHTPAPEMLAEALGVLDAPHQTWQMNVDWQYKAHAVVVAEDSVDGPPLWAEVAIDQEPAARRPTALAWFPGEIFTFDDLPVSVPDDLEICAALWVSEIDPPRLYVNEYARCHYGHLDSDVTCLLSDFATSGPDAGWDSLDTPEGGWITAIATSAAVSRMHASRRR